VATHEHADHVNGFGKKGADGKMLFEPFDIDRLWLAWTEDPDDDIANELRKKHKDVLLGILGADHALAAATDDEHAARTSDHVRALLELECEGVVEEFAADGKKIKGITNKKAIDYIRKQTDKRPRYLRPHDEPYDIPNVPGVDVYVLGPPRDPKLLRSMDPKGDEGYTTNHHLAADTDFCLAAFSNHGDADECGQPFASRHRIPRAELPDSDHATFFADHYADDDHGWRRIQTDWLHSAEQLALRMNSATNNTSLVMAFQLPNTKRVLLFTGDAQRGNWLSWDDGTWTGPDGPVSAKDLLSHTVLYKVGHHGSHNATLKGRSSSDYANLGWFGVDSYRDEFVAMIPANADWAQNKSHPWIHPLPSIARALGHRSKGRVFRADEAEPTPSSSLSDEQTEDFATRMVSTGLYIEYTVTDAAD
jgi:hypothetical protein